VKLPHSLCRTVGVAGGDRVPEAAATADSTATLDIHPAVTKPGEDTEVIGWGMEFDDSAFMITADGRNQYFLSEAENALMYVRGEPDTTADLVWVAPAVLVSPDPAVRG
jgi:hypothetical protein